MPAISSSPSTRGNFTSVNGSGESISGYRRQELLCMNLRDLAAPESLPAVQAALQQSGRQAETRRPRRRLVARDGTGWPMEVSGRLQFLRGLSHGCIMCGTGHQPAQAHRTAGTQRGEVSRDGRPEPALDAVLWRVEEMIELYFAGAAARIILTGDSLSGRPARRPDHGHNRAHNHGHRGLSGPSGGAHPGLRRRWAGAVGDFRPDALAAHRS